MVSSNTTFVVPNFGKSEPSLNVFLFFPPFLFHNFKATAPPRGCTTQWSAVFTIWPTSSSTGRVDRLTCRPMIPSLSCFTPLPMQSLTSGSAGINRVHLCEYSNNKIHFGEWMDGLTYSSLSQVTLFTPMRTLPLDTTAGSTWFLSGRLSPMLRCLCLPQKTWDTHMRSSGRVRSRERVSMCRSTKSRNCS